MASFVHLIDQRRLIGPGGITTGGEIAFYYTGTTIKAPIYQDAALLIPSENPVVVAAGQTVPLIFLDDNIDYRRVITYSDGSTDEQDPLGNVFSEGELGLPVGGVIDHAGLTAPDGFAFCFGQELSRTEYSELFDVIGTQYGPGNGTTTFNVPDYRGRVGAGKDNMGGVAANRLTSASVNGLVLGQTGGTELHILTVAQLAAHGHSTTVTDPGHSHSLPVYSNSGSGSYIEDATTAGGGQTVNTGTATTGITVVANDTGSNEGHLNVQPTIVINKIIKTTSTSFLSLLGVDLAAEAASAVSSINTIADNRIADINDAADGRIADVEAAGQEKVGLAQAWAEDPGEPGGPGTKSAKGWAEEASLGRLAPIIELTVAGTANAITATMPSGMTAYANGQMFRFFPTADNTGAVTLQIGGLAANQIVAKGGSALQAGDLKAGQPYTIRVSATSGNFRLINDLPREVLASAALTGTPTAPTAAVGTNSTQVATTALVQGEKSRPFATLAPSGTDTLTVAAPSGVSAYTSNQYFKVLIVNRNTGPVTLNIGGLGALPVQTSTGVALAAGQLPPGWWEMRCNGSSFRIMEKLPAELFASPVFTGTPTAPTAAVGTNSTQVATTALIQNEKVRPYAVLAPSGTDTLTVAAPAGYTAYSSNQYFRVIITDTNTGAVTLNIGGLGALPVKTSQGVALSAGQLTGGFYMFRCSGTDFRIMERLPAELFASPVFTGTPTAPTAAVGTNTNQVATAALLQGEKSRPFVTLAPTGTDTLTVAAPTGVTSYASNQYFKVLIVNRNTGPVTLNIGSLGALPVQTSTGVALAAGQLPPGWWEMRCNGSSFRLMEKLPHEIEADLLRSPRLIGQHTLPIDVSNPNTPPLTGSFAGEPVHGFTATGMCRAHNGLWAIANCGVATETKITNNDPADFAPSIVFVTPDFSTKVYEILLRPILPNSKVIQGIALDTTNNSYWVADIQGQRFRNISYAGTLLGSIELATVAGWDTAGTVNGLAYDPTQHGLWCNPQLTDEIYLLDIATQTIVNTFTGQPTDIDHFYYDDATKYLWWTRGNNGSTGLVTIFNTVTGTVVSNNWVPQSLAIEGLHYDSTLDRLYTVNDAALHVTAGTPPVAYVAEYEFAA